MSERDFNLYSRCRACGGQRMQPPCGSCYGIGFVVAFQHVPQPAQNAPTPPPQKAPPIQYQQQPQYGDTAQNQRPQQGSQQPSQGGNLATDAQRKFIYDLAGQLGMSFEDITAQCQIEFGAHGVDQLTRRDASQMIERMKALVPQQPSR